jgi:predicted nucleic acid-binding Zn ribbon protein
MPQTYCARCGKPIAVDKWYLCDDCDRLQPRYLASKNNKPIIKNLYDFSK